MRFIHINCWKFKLLTIKQTRLSLVWYLSLRFVLKTCNAFMNFQFNWPLPEENFWKPGVQKFPSGGYHCTRCLRARSIIDVSISWYFFLFVVSYLWLDSCIAKYILLTAWKSKDRKIWGNHNKKQVLFVVKKVLHLTKYRRS